MNTPMVRLWRGQKIEDMSREDLEEAFHWLADQYMEHTADKAIRQRSIGRVEMLKRGAA